MSPNAEFRTGVARSPEDYEACFRVRYNVYVEEMGKEPPGSDHQRKIITDDLDAKAVILYAAVGDEIVGTFRFIYGGDGIPEEYKKYFSLDLINGIPDTAISFNSRLMITSKWRKTQALAGLLDIGYREGRKRGVWLSFLHCAPSLISLYEMLGFRRYALGMIDTDVGLHIPMLLIADDIEHLNEVHSPYLKSIDGVENNPLHAQWFQKTFPKFANGTTTRYMGFEQFSALLSERMEVADHPLFKGIAIEQLNTILKHGVLLHPKEGDLIHREGERSQELFVVLRGAIELLGNINKVHAKVLHTLGVGEVFGEMAFISGRNRLTTARALCDTELLAINGAFADKLAVSHPEVAALFFLNISRLLAHRVSATTNAWLGNLAQLEATISSWHSPIPSTNEIDRRMSI